MDIILWVLFGGITAWIAGIFIGTHSLQRVLGSIALGVVGAVIAGGIMRILTGQDDGSVNYYSLLLAIAGSLFIVAFVANRKV
jgi:uncharacterized membrane protein YeaQ/YmgE (transglycosylase-associated protein family)